MLTYVSSRVSVTGAVMTSVSVAVAVGATVLKIVMKPMEDVTVESGGAPPDGSTTMVPGRPEMLIVISPSPAVTVMMLPLLVDVDWGASVAVCVGVMAESVAFVEAIVVGAVVLADAVVTEAVPAGVSEVSENLLDAVRMIWGDAPEVLVPSVTESAGGGLDN